jgi:hypothetical protein
VESLKCKGQGVFHLKLHPSYLKLEIDVSPVAADVAGKGDFGGRGTDRAKEFLAAGGRNGGFSSSPC